MIKKLSKSVRQYKKDAVLTPVFVMFEVILEVIIPLLMSRLIDFGIDDGSMEYILQMGAALVISSLISLAFGVLAGNSAARASAGFASNLREDMYHNVQTFSFSNIDRFSTASLVTRLTTDVSNVQMAFQMLIRMAFRSPLMLIFSTSMAMSIDPQLSLIFLACIPVLGLGMYLVMTKAHPIFERVFKTYDKLNGVVQENLRGIRVVKSFVREDYEDKKFDTISESIYKDFSKAEKTIAYTAPLMQFCMYTCILFISWFGARAIIASGNNPDLGLSTGELMSLLTYIMQILMSLMMLSMVFVMLTISRASAERIVAVLDEKSDITDCDEPVYTVADGSIRFENVNFGYGEGKKICLNDIDLDIASGQTIGILGGTGAGKSTLVQLIPRLYDTVSGTVYVGGVDVKKYDIKTLRDSVAMVLQKNELFSGTISDNLRWGDENATDEELREACRLSCADQFVQEKPGGYDAEVEQGGTNVSGGQKQRLCIARALLKKPKILILDDSTSAVDTKTDAQIRASLRSSMPDTTKLIIAQRVLSVMDADKIIVMDGGTIVAAGTHDELLKSSPIYKEVYESQMKGGEEE